MAKYVDEKREFVQQMVKEGVSVEDADKILADANHVQRWAYVECCRELRADERELDEKAQARIRSVVRKYGIEARFSGDPRGCCVKLVLKSGAYNTWGGREAGYGVPTRDY